MPMQIQVDTEPFLVHFLHFLCEPQEMVDLREGELARLVEGAIEILAEEAGPVVAGNHTVWVEHGHDIKEILVA